ncbi:MAG TPA: metallophosphoesterase [Myxococcota bacterium]|nr:metallophosphoesterase [Myxococcota bacterium]HRY94025.1 metallophosphoesterase [Myxococcota bacterium]
MKKLKLVVSDFHLGNGPTLPDGSVNQLEDFVYDEQFIEFLQHHSAQAGQDVDLELILNGDLLNMVQLLPHEQHLGLLTERAAVAKLEAILAGHQALFEALRTFNSAPRRRVVFIMGNHDPQLLWRDVQERLRSVVGGEVVFVDDAYRFDGVHVEHGHQLEPIFEMRKDRYFLTKGYTEPVLNLPWGVFFVTDYLYRIKRRRPYADKVGPYRLYLRWCLWNDFWFFVSEIFRYLWFIVRTRFGPLPLARAGSRKALQAVFHLARSPTLVDGVKKIIARERCRIVILGHTHIPVHQRLEGGEYLNPGCWNDVTGLDIANLGRFKRLLYVQLEYRDDKPQARLLEWIGFHHPSRAVRL